MFSVKILNTVVSVNIGFLAVIALITLNGGDYSGLSFAACMIHEAGHIAAVHLSGSGVKRISFGIKGISMYREEGMLISPSADIMILISGPAANLFTALMVFLFSRETGYFFIINIILGIFNLLPFSVLDGGAAADIFFEYHFTGGKCRIFLLVFNILLCFVLITFLRRMPFFNVSFYITGIFLCAAEIKKLSEIID
ncbi:MAG: hypothetical protein ACI4KB_06005 [Oscillospiraceae bacterium]|nr:hypothetical protein [Oscillospiraceae bacterium]